MDDFLKVIVLHGRLRPLRAEYTDLFNKYDLNGDSVLSRDELRLMVKDMFVAAVEDARSQGAPDWYVRKAMAKLDEPDAMHTFDRAVNEILPRGASSLSYEAFIAQLERAERKVAMTGRHWRLAPIFDVPVVLDDFVDPYRREKIFLAGGAAGALSRTVGAPLARAAVLRQTALQRGARRQNLVSLMRSIARTEGLAGFFRGNLIDVSRTVPASGIAFVLFDVLKVQLAALEPDSATHNASRFVAGGLAGCAALLSVYPLDLARTRRMCAVAAAPGAASPPGALSAAALIARAFKAGGLGSLYRGAGLACVEKFPSVGANFVLYDVARRRLDGAGLRNPLLAPLLAGAVAGSASMVATYPLDLVIKNLQLDATKRYAGVWDCVRQVFLRSGVRGFFAGMGVSVAKSVPMTCASFVAYSQLKDSLGVYAQ